MGKIAVIKTGYTEHSYYIKQGRETNGKRTCANPDDPETHDMEQKKGDSANPVYAFFYVNGFGFNIVIRIEHSANVLAKGDHKVKHDTGLSSVCDKAK
jgi:hypothetical protein